MPNTQKNNDKKEDKDRKTGSQHQGKSSGHDDKSSESPARKSDNS